MKTGELAAGSVMGRLRGLGTSDRIALVAVGLAAACHLFLYFVTLVVSPLGFDEAFILQAPLNLVQGNGYSTEDWLTGGPNPQFDAIVSTGPVIGMPVALSFLVFGVSIEAARIVTLPFFVLLLICLVILGRRYAGWWGAAAALGTLLLFDSRADFPITVVYGPSDAIGEYTTAALIALAAVLLPKRRALVGLVIGIAMLAKFIAAMAIPAFLLALLLVPRDRSLGWGRRIRELLAFVGWAAIPSVLWELVKLVSIGPEAYAGALVGYLRFVFRSGSGIDGSSDAALNPQLWFDRGSRLFSAWQIPTLSMIVLGAIVIALACVGLAVYARSRGFDPAHLKGFRARVGGFFAGVGVEVVATAATLGVFVVWWVFISSSNFIRHTMPVLIATVPLISAFAVLGLTRLVARGGIWRAVGAVGAAVAVVLGVWGGIANSIQAFSSPIWSRADQQATADFVRGLGVDDVQGIDWWAAPDVRFLSQVPSKPVGMGTGPLVLAPITRELVLDLYVLGESLCTDVLFEQNGYVVCDVAPDQPVLDLGSDD